MKPILKDSAELQKRRKEFVCFPLCVRGVYRTYAEYQKYKADELKNASDYRMQEFQALEVLESLGFPIEHLGTHLYKNMIIKAMHYLNGVDDYGRAISNNQLKQQMMNPFSQFYVDLGRNDSDIGVKTFHLHIEDAFSKIDYDNADVALMQEIHSDFSGQTDYASFALEIAEYIGKASEKNESVQYCKNAGVKFYN